MKVLATMAAALPAEPPQAGSSRGCHWRPVPAGTPLDGLVLGLPGQRRPEAGVVALPPRSHGCFFR